MKRPPMPPRKTPFRAKTALQNKSRLNQLTGMSRQAVKPRSKPLTYRPAPMSPEEKRARELVEARAAGRCEGCGRPGPAEWSHRVGAAQGGQWSADNGLALCGDLTGGRCLPDANGSQSHGGGCHPWAHRNVELAKAPGRGWMVDRGTDPATVPALIYGRGLVYLDAAGGVTPATEGEAA